MWPTTAWQQEQDGQQTSQWAFHIGILSARLKSRIHSSWITLEGMGLTPSVSRVLAAILLIIGVLLMGGCDPLVNIEGAFFPAWLVSGVSGLVAMVITWNVFRRIGVDQHLLARPFTYISLLVMYTCLVWLIFYAN